MKNLKRIILLPILLICILMQTILLRFCTLDRQQYSKAYDTIMVLEKKAEALRKEDKVEEIEAFASAFTPTDIFIQTSDEKTIWASLDTTSGAITYKYYSQTKKEWVVYPANSDIDVKGIIQSVAKNGGDSKDKTKVV